MNYNTKTWFDNCRGFGGLIVFIIAFIIIIGQFQDDRHYFDSDASYYISKICLSFLASACIAPIGGIAIGSIIVPIGWILSSFFMEEELIPVIIQNEEKIDDIIPDRFDILDL